ncbi:MAG: hypothetical protein LBH22_01120 [Bacteroidales bacterium]|jgi:hypothetical protein|nr:hypothetical protein [Bacteroidales bacterium]
MGAYEKQNLDFVKRTKKITEQYKEYGGNFDVTLLLNCLVGLLIIPYEDLRRKLPEKLPEKIIDRENWGISEHDISIILDRDGMEERKSVKNVAKHLRNSIAHYEFMAFPDEEANIKTIRFEDRLRLSPHEWIVSFEAIISIVNLRIFVNKLSEYYINEIEKEMRFEKSS